MPRNLPLHVFGATASAAATLVRAEFFATQQPRKVTAVPLSESGTDFKQWCLIRDKRTAQFVVGGLMVSSKNSADRMGAAASTWLDSLTPHQRSQATRPWPSADERHRWYYTPTDHGGLALQQMSSAQQSLAMQLLATGLSHPGYVTASTIMGLENVLDQVDGWPSGWGRERIRDPQLYSLTVFGEPGPGRPWSWRFGGHHVSVQHLVLDGQVQASSPCFFGADPARAPLLGGQWLRPLGAAEDLARDLLISLDDEQTARAVISPVAPVDIVTGNRPRIGDGDRVMSLADVWRSFAEPRLRDLAASAHDRAEAKAGFRPEHDDALAFTQSPKGLAAGDMSTRQQDRLRDLLTTYVERIPAELAASEAQKFDGDRLRDVHFAWAGDVAPGQPHYYRLQGPRLLAEYDNTQRDANHVHTVWRDPVNDFGDDVLARHLATFHTSM